MLSIRAAAFANRSFVLSSMRALRHTSESKSARSSGTSLKAFHKRLSLSTPSIICIMDAATPRASDGDNRRGGYYDAPTPQGYSSAKTPGATWGGDDDDDDGPGYN